MWSEFAEILIGGKFHNKINFYFASVLPELACARHHKGGIRE